MEVQHLNQLPDWNGLVLPGPQEETKQVSWVLFAPEDRRVRGSEYREKLHVLYHWSSGGETISHSTTYLVICQHDLNPNLLIKKKNLFSGGQQLKNKSLSKQRGHMLSKRDLLKIIYIHIYTHIQVQHISISAVKKTAYFLNQIFCSWI